MGPRAPLSARQQLQEQTAISDSVCFWDYMGFFTVPSNDVRKNNLINLCFKICLRNVPRGVFEMSDMFL